MEEQLELTYGLTCDLEAACASLRKKGCTDVGFTHELTAEGLQVYIKCEKGGKKWEDGFVAQHPWIIPKMVGMLVNAANTLEV